MYDVDKCFKALAQAYSELSDAEQERYMATNVCPYFPNPVSAVSICLN